MVLISEWCVEAGYPIVDFKTVEPEYLADLLREFYGSAAPRVTEGRKKSLSEVHAQEYHKNTLKNMRGAINRHLNDLHRGIDIVRDKQFLKCNNLLNAKLKYMVKSGLSRPTAHKKIITDIDMQKIATYLLAVDDAQVLQYKVWYSLGVHFVSQGLEFQRQLTLSSFLFLKDDKGRVYVTLSHKTQQKNAQGSLSDSEAISDKHMYSTGDVDCPVSALRKFMCHCDPSAPALFSKLKPNPTNYIWYTCKALSLRKLSKFMANISQNAKCNTIYTPQSVRTTAINLLSNARFETRHIMLMSGNPNKTSNTQNKVTSDTLLAANDSEHCDPVPQPVVPALLWRSQPSGSIGPLVLVPVNQQPSLPVTSQLSIVKAEPN